MEGKLKAVLWPLHVHPHSCKWVCTYDIQVQGGEQWRYPWSASDPYQVQCTHLHILDTGTQGHTQTQKTLGFTGRKWFVSVFLAAIPCFVNFPWPLRFAEMLDFMWWNITVQRAWSGCNCTAMRKAETKRSQAQGSVHQHSSRLASQPSYHISRNDGRRNFSDIVHRFTDILYVICNFKKKKHF